LFNWKDAFVKVSSEDIFFSWVVSCKIRVKSLWTLWIENYGCMDWHNTILIKSQLTSDSLMFADSIQSQKNIFQIKVFVNKKQNIHTWLMPTNTTLRLFSWKYRKCCVKLRKSVLTQLIDSDVVKVNLNWKDLLNLHLI
jgi:hypothetical protein